MPRSVENEVARLRNDMLSGVRPAPPNMEVDETSAISVARSTRSLGSELRFREDDPPEIWKNKLDELALRVELERVLRLQRESELEKLNRGLIAD